MRWQTARMCKPCGKKLYTSERQARKVAEERTVPLRVYWCDRSRGWHLTKQEAGHAA